MASGALLVVVVVLDAAEPNKKLGGLFAASEALKFSVGIAVLSLLSEPKLKLRLGLTTAVTEVEVVEVGKLELVLFVASEVPEPDANASAGILGPTGKDLVWASLGTW